MKKFIIMLVAVSLLIIPITSFAENDNEINISAKAAVLMDAGSGKILYEKNGDQPLAIASVTKVMTLNLIFDAIENKNISLDEKIIVSESAASMGGSQAFIDAGYIYSVKDLIKAIIIGSANDAAVAMAERVCGSESAFVNKMNIKAKELGMNNTTFKNSTGLPEDGHLSTARDVAIMSMELLNHNDYFKWSNIWMDEIYHEKDGRVTELVNTNKLIRSLQGCNGLKTGYTNEAGFCVTTSVERGDMKLISVVLGGETSKSRFNDSVELINYGFANYKNECIVKAGDIYGEVQITNGVEEKLKTIAVENFTLCKKIDGNDVIETRTELPEKINAPILEGQEIGKIIISLNGTDVGEVKLYADKNYKKASFIDKLKEIVSFWK